MKTESIKTVKVSFEDSDFDILGDMEELLVNLLCIMDKDHCDCIVTGDGNYVHKVGIEAMLEKIKILYG